MSDFYEDDEPVEKIREAFARGQKMVTKRPRDLNQRAVSIRDCWFEWPVIRVDCWFEWPVIRVERPTGVTVTR